MDDADDVLNGAAGFLAGPGSMDTWAKVLERAPAEDTTYYPVGAFYFKVVFPGFSSDTSFQDVTGIGGEMEIEEIAEGGENLFVHRVPTRMKYRKLVLKRGITTKQSDLMTWCSAVLGGGLAVPIAPKDTVLVQMMKNGLGAPVRAWNFNNVYPVKWELDALNSTKSDVAIETIELVTNKFQRCDLGLSVIWASRSGR